MSDIHPTAIVADGAEFRERTFASVRFVPFQSMRNWPTGVVLESHVVIDGRTKIGANTRDISFLRNRHAAAGFEVRG